MDTEPEETGEYSRQPLELNETERLAWVRLIQSEGIGPATFHELIEHFGSATAALDALPALGKRTGITAGRRICSEGEAVAVVEAAETAGARLILFSEANYPPLLKHIPAPPPLLYARGRPELAARATVAIVGSRQASAIGREFTARLACELGAAGVTVVSGLARGIDTAAHQAALASATVAVIAGGIDIVYPPENAALHEAIAQQGLLLCESPPGFAPRGQDFPRRNRIISGLSSGVVVVEAAKKSGSLITARLALEQGREVFAVPGHPLDPRAAGTNGLIKNGAQLISGADDVLSELSFSFRSLPLQCREDPERPALYGSSADHATTTSVSSADAQSRIIDALGVTPVQPDILLRQTGLRARDLTVALIQLDMAGLIERDHNGRVSLRPTAVGS